jgi:ribosomal protein S18 acetylase RimI-like enzyme
MKPQSTGAPGKRAGERSRKSELAIRAAGKVDAPALAKLMGELGYPTRASEMEMRLESILNDPNYRTFVATSHGEVCGMVGTCCFYSHEHNSPGGRIIALVVSETMRGQGVGRELVRIAEKDFVSRNVTRIALNTRTHRKEAHLFYERLGYEMNGFRFVKNLEGLAD